MRSRKNDVAARTAVTAIGAAAWDEGFAAKADAAGAAVAAGNSDCGFVDKTHDKLTTRC